MRTVGVEEELLLVEPRTGRPRSVAARVLRTEAARGISHEFQREQVETDTAPQTEMAALETELRAWRERAGAGAREAGARIVASGTSPLPVHPHLFRNRRYRRMAERYGITAQEQLTCGCHVHVAVEDEEEGVGVLDRVRLWLPCLLALSANSPYWQGRDTRYSSFRSQAQYRWPSSGPPDQFGSAAAYRQRVVDMVASGVLLDEGMVYFDVRLSRRYPTVEFRVADVCLDVGDAVLLAALCRGLVDTAAEEWAADVPAAEVSSSMLRLATWQASRDGLTAELLDPVTFRPRPARELIDELAEHLDKALCANGDSDLVHERIERVFARGNGAMRQRTVLAETGSLSAVVGHLARVTTGEDG